MLQTRLECTRRLKRAAACSIVACLLGFSVSAEETNWTGVQFTDFLVDGLQRLPEVPQTPESKIRFSTEHQGLRFSFAPSPALSKKPVRLRYRLEGYESGWHDTGEPMRFVVHFRDSQNVPVGSADFPVHGESPGWTGEIVTSPFIERHESVVVPDRCTNARIWIPSGGNPDTVGVYVIDNLKVIALAQPGQEEKVLLFDDFQSGRDLDNPLGALDGWMRDGTSLSIAQIAKTGHGTHDHALALIDDSSDKFGAWDAEDTKLLPVKPGDILLFEWKEMYSIGGCGPATVDYKKLPPGEYRFVVSIVSPFGVPTGEQAALSFRVVPPFYMQGWFRGLFLLAGGGLLVGSVRYAVWRRLQRRIESLDMQHLVEKERARIAQDIHDDLGTRLTRISLISEAVRRNAKGSAELASGLDEIRGTAMEMTQALDEIVWAVDPRQDSLESLVSYLAESAQDLLTVAGIKCRFSFPVQLPPWSLFPEVRHNLFLAFKEVLNNAIKHANATEVHIGLELGAARIAIWICDNGHGFAPDFEGQPDDSSRKLRGNGLSNLKARLNKIKGSVEIQSQPGQGTKVVFNVPVQSTVANDVLLRD